jgi:hypothetical protein
LDVKEEIGELSKQYKTLKHQIKQLQENIKSKGQEILKQTKNHEYLIAECDETQAKKAALSKKLT